MKKTITIIIFLLIIILVAGNIIYFHEYFKEPEIITEYNYKEPLVIEPADETLYEEYINNQINEAMSKMTLKEKIGQMIIIQMDGTTITDKLKKDINEKNIGGVILFSKNIKNYKQTTTLISNLKKSSKYPLFMAVDEEGGLVQRINKISGFPYVPSMSSLGSKNNLNLTYQVGQTIGEELRILGFNVDFAPDTDVAYNSKSVMYGRSFGSSPEKVGKQVVAFSNGLENKNIISSYKHFPGHGATTTDSHYALPVLNKTKAELLKTDLVPFKTAIDNNAEMIMIGHLSIPKLTKNNTPSSLSKEIITDLLKKDLGYKGIVITDALNMGAITNNYTEKQIYEMAINAGVDILLMPNNYNNAITYIEKSVKEGKIKESQIDESVRKILSLKYRKIDSTSVSKNVMTENNHTGIINLMK